MDDEARAALAHLLRTELAPDFERVSADLERVDALAAQLEELRLRTQLLEQAAGIQIRGPRGVHARRCAVIALRAQGHSLRKIEVLLGVARNTVEADLRKTRVSVPAESADTLALDGKPMGRRSSNGRAPRSSNGRFRA